MTSALMMVTVTLFEPLVTEGRNVTRHNNTNINHDKNNIFFNVIDYVIYTMFDLILKHLRNSVWGES